tara:strand:- start:664 stop:981 length:318 start_codon:yes stop_codon:yes gene_type:complete
MSDINNLVKKSNFIIPLVGNKFFKNKPSKKDTKILLIPDPKNKHDPNAVAVYSRRGETLLQLGFIIKDKCKLVKEHLEVIKNIKLVRSVEKNDENLYYYYLVINI